MRAVGARLGGVVELFSLTSDGRRLPAAIARIRQQVGIANRYTSFSAVAFLIPDYISGLAGHRGEGVQFLDRAISPPRFGRADNAARISLCSRRPQIDCSGRFPRSMQWVIVIERGDAGSVQRVIPDGPAFLFEAQLAGGRAGSEGSVVRLARLRRRWGCLFGKNDFTRVESG